jgi:hypothetical protein
MDQILDQAVAPIPVEETPAEILEDKEASVDSSYEGSSDSGDGADDDEGGYNPLLHAFRPQPKLTWKDRLFQTRTIKGGGKNGKDLPPWWMGDYGDHGSLTTVEVTEKFKEKIKTKNRALAAIEKARAIKKRNKLEEEEKKLRKHYFQIKVDTLKREAAELKRIHDSKAKAMYNRKIAESRVYNLLVIGKEGAERKKIHAARMKKEADEAKKAKEYEAYIEAKNAEKKRRDDDVEYERQCNATADLLMRKFGVMEGISKTYIAASPPKIIQGDEEFVDLYYSVGKIEDGSEEEGPIDACLSVDLMEFPYCRKIDCHHLGKYGAKELSIVLRPKQVLGSTDIVAGACEGLVELNLAGNKILSQGINDLRKGFLKGALPRLQILKLDGNNFGCTGARCIAECIEKEGCLSKLTYLSMRDNSIADFGGMRLASAIYKGLSTKLEELDLSQNIMKRGGIMALTRALETNPYKTNFKTLRLRNNRISIDCARRLSKRSPPFLIF